MPETPVLSPRLPTPETLRDQVVLEEHDLAPDGSFAVVTRRVVDGEAYVSHVWLAPLDGAEPRQLTSGAVRDMEPRISPDGSRVVFTRCAPEVDRKDIVILEIASATTAAPAIGELSARDVRWSPDGRRLAFRARTDPQRLIVGPVPEPGTTAGGDAAGAGDAPEPRARRITTLDYRWDETGYIDRRRQLFVVDAEEGAVPRQLTWLACGVDALAWRPDGAAIAVVADPREDADLRPRTSIWEVAVPGGPTGNGGDAGGAGDAGDSGDPGILGSAADPAFDPAPREILALAGPVARPAYSPDGRWIAGVGVDDPDFFDDVSPTLFVGPADGSGHAVALAPDLDRPIGNWADTDLTGWQGEQDPGPAWDGADGVIALITDRGRTHPWRFPVDPATGHPAEDPVRLAWGDVMAHTLGIGGGRVSVTTTVGARPPELCIVEPWGEVRPLTALGSSWIDGLAWPEMHCVEAPGPGGPVETWIASPAAGVHGRGRDPLSAVALSAGVLPTGALPTIVDVHGGPLGAWSPAPSLEVVLLCARGYRVILPNIRGSASYGGEWIRPQLGDWGGPDADDVHAAVDHVVALGLADPDRLGVLGLSYGGFMVNWLVGTTDRFRAGVSENGVTNQVSAWAHSDSGPEYCRAARMGDPTTPEGVQQLWRQSPLRNVASVRTPLLLLQSEADRRCPAADNEQFFAALRWLRREVEYVVYPEEYHVIQATGRIDRRIDRMTRMLDWFDRFVLA
jgi:dipeptidyl aminopeptidase/acylaminoacyl peptidase